MISLPIEGFTNTLTFSAELLSLILVPGLKNVRFRIPKGLRLLLAVEEADEKTDPEDSPDDKDHVELVLAIDEASSEVILVLVSEVGESF